MKAHTRYYLIGATIALLSGAPCHAATEFVGNITSDKFKVQDGDGLKLNGLQLRLQGVDAFEKNQTCTSRGQTWPCGYDASEALKTKIKNHTVLCNLDSIDHYGRPLATCFIDGENLNAWIVKSGWGLAYRKYSTAYVREEEQAKESKRGAWRGEFMEPWNWRHGRYGR